MRDFIFLEYNFIVHLLLPFSRFVEMFLQGWLPCSDAFVSHFYFCVSTRILDFNSNVFQEDWRLTSEYCSRSQSSSQSCWQRLWYWLRFIIIRKRDINKQGWTEPRSFVCLPPRSDPRGFSYILKPTLWTDQNNNMNLVIGLPWGRVNKKKSYQRPLLLFFF